MALHADNENEMKFWVQVFEEFEGIPRRFSAIIDSTNCLVLFEEVTLQEPPKKNKRFQVQIRGVRDRSNVPHILCSVLYDPTPTNTSPNSTTSQTTLYSHDKIESMASKKYKRPLLTDLC